MADRFEANIAAFIRRTGMKGVLVVKKLSFDAFRGIVMKTPVDTGRARANWRIGVNVINLTTTGAPGEEGAAGASETGKLNGIKWGDSIAISNNLPYIGALENGHSRQAPNGMLHLTFVETKANLAKALKSVGG